MIDDIDDSDLTTLYAYWTRKRGGSTMPRRTDIDPSEIPSLLPHVFIAEIHWPLRFRLRLVGTAICARWGENLTGEWLDELDCNGQRTAMLQQYASVAQTGVPSCDSEEFVSAQGKYLHYKRLLLPLSEDGCTPNMVFGGQKAIGIDGYDVLLPKWM